MTIERIGDATLYLGDVRECPREMADESVHCVVTSPPYWGQRDYGIEPSVWGGDAKCEHSWIERRYYTEKSAGKNSIAAFSAPGQENVERLKAARWRQDSTCEKCGAWLGCLGLEPTPELYVQHLVEVFRGVRPKLRKDGTVWLNIATCYASGNRSTYRSGVSDNKGHLVQNNQARPRTPPGLKSKDICMIPALVALALQADGWWLRSDIIWHKPNPMPESCTDRPTKSHEYLFLLSKSGTAQYWTHRDHNGTRKKPKPDYRWLDKLLDVEFTEEPPNWRTEMMPNTIGETVTDEDGEECEPKKVRRYKRINLWRGHDYYYDQEAIKEPASPDTHARYARGRSNNHKWADGGPGNQTIARTFEHMRQPGVNPKCAEPGLGIRQNSSFSAAVKDIVGSRNRRTVWTIATQSYKEAHFATFPEALVEPCVLAGCPAQACPECGAPWVRVVERERRPGSSPTRKDMHSHRSANNKDRHDAEDERYHSISRTLGFRPTCSCGRGDTVPGVMLDPFAGAGTSLKVALRLGRRAVGCEIKPEYMAMTRKRIREEAAQGKLELQA